MSGQLFTRKTWAESLSDLKTELIKWGIQDYLLPTFRESEKEGKVIVRFAINGHWSELECSIGATTHSRYDARTSLRAIYLAVEAARKADQRGIGALLAEATRYLALPSGNPTAYEVLGVPNGGDAATLRKAYMDRVKETHPDRDGSEKEFRAVQAAAEELGVA